MASASTRYEIVVRAIKLAGTDISKRGLAEELLNDFLRSLAIEGAFPELRKVGTEIALTTGQSTAALPADFGFGMENLLYGTSKLPLIEMDIDTFVARGGFYSSGQGAGAPGMYVVDKNAGVLRFDRTADIDYALIPIYFSLPVTIPISDSTGDATKPWVSDDNLCVQGLIQMLYQYLGDQREMVQEQKVERLKGNYKRGVMKSSGGTTTVNLSSRFFKRR